MPIRNTVISQKISSEKRQRAKELRQNMTPEETLLWRALRTNKLAGWHFRRQQIIDGFIVDFYCHAASLIIEVDGGIHATQKEQDAEREAHLVSRCFRILRVWNDEVNHDIDAVLRKILENLKQT
jgi:very-short-patch-repair endonuclease